MTSFWLVRHGQTDWNLSGRWQGQSPDAPALNNTGQAQVLSLCSQLETLPVSAIYASDLLRTRQTAEILAKPLGLQVILEPRLREMDLGEWEGMYLDEIKLRFPQELRKRALDPLHTPAPGGESPEQMVARVVTAANQIGMRHCGESVMLVAHGVSLAVLICVAQGIPMEKIYDYLPENAKLSKVEWNLPHQTREFSSGIDHRMSILRVQDGA